MFSLLARLFCRHVWIKTCKPYLYDAGRTKRCNVMCTICGKESNVDIFDVKPDRWHKGG